MQTSKFALSTGRSVGVTTFGDPQAEYIVVIVHPDDASSPLDPDPKVTASRALQILSIDRPGVGHPDPTSRPEPLTHLEAANDIACSLRVELSGSESWGGPREVGWRSRSRRRIRYSIRGSRS